MKKLVLAALLVVACSKADEPTSTGSGSSGAASSSSSSSSSSSGDNPRDALLAAWKKAGLDVGAFAPAQTDVGKDCQTGKVAKLDVLICLYKKPEDAKSSEEFGLQWVGSVTGASQAHGAMVIAIADKAKADPHGKTINQLLKLAPN